MKLKLPPAILSLLQIRGATMNKALRGSPSDLAKRCSELDYAAHDSILAFEAAFGGLMMPEEGSKLKKNMPVWIFGTKACLDSDSHSRPRGGKTKARLVPVVYSPNDIIYFLDAEGRAYAQDTIADPSASLFAENGTALVCRILLEDAIFSRLQTTLELEGLHGDRISNQYHLALIAEASDRDYRYFSNADGSFLLVEEIRNKRTRLAIATKKQFELVKKNLSPAAEKISPAMRPFAGKAEIRMAAAQLESLPEFFEHLPELRDLDVSSNRLKQLPETLWNTIQLTRLDMSFNPLQSLPEGIGRLKNLRSLIMRGCPLRSLPEALAEAKNLTNLNLTECEELDVDAALPIIARLPKLRDLSLPLSRSLRSLAPLAVLPLKSLLLGGARVQHPERLPAGLGLLKKLTDLRIEYADEIALLPESPADIAALRLLFAKRFTDDDIRKLAGRQPEVLYLRAFAETL